MSLAKIPLVTMHNYSDGGIWADATFPPGFNKQTFINTILLNYGELETLYADPDFMKFAITNWSETHYWGINRAVIAINKEYEPLENYDRRETRTLEYKDAETEQNTGTVSHRGTNTGTVSNRGTNTGTVTNAQTVTTANDTSVSSTSSGSTDIDETATHQVSAFDSSSYSNSSKDIIDRKESSTGRASSTTDFNGSETTNATRTDNLANSNTRTDNLQNTDTQTNNLQNDKNGSGVENETIRAHGNIGVTTSQQMLAAELEIALYNLYETYAGVFATNLLLMVY